MAQHRMEENITLARISEPSLAERARTLAHLGSIGSLSILSARHPGWP